MMLSTQHVRDRRCVLNVRRGNREKISQAQRIFRSSGWVSISIAGVGQRVGGQWMYPKWTGLKWDQLRPPDKFTSLYGEVGLPLVHALFFFSLQPAFDQLGSASPSLGGRVLVCLCTHSAQQRHVKVTGVVLEQGYRPSRSPTFVSCPWILSMHVQGVEQEVGK